MQETQQYREIFVQSRTHQSTTDRTLIDFDAELLREERRHINDSRNSCNRTSPESHESRTSESGVILTHVISCPNVRVVFLCQESPWLCLVQLSTTFFFCLFSFLLVSLLQVDDATNKLVAVFPVPACSSNVGASDGSAPDLDGMGARSSSKVHAQLIDFSRDLHRLTNNLRISRSSKSGCPTWIHPSTTYWLASRRNSLQNLWHFRYPHASCRDGLFLPRVSLHPNEEVGGSTATGSRAPWMKNTSDLQQIRNTFKKCRAGVSAQLEDCEVHCRSGSKSAKLALCSERHVPAIRGTVQ